MKKALEKNTLIGSKGIIGMADWKEKLYNYGFLLTDNKGIFQNDIGLEHKVWNEISVGNYFLFYHQSLNTYLIKGGDKIFLLIGHAYNPFTMEKEEISILEKLNSLYGKTDYQNYLDQITGVFFYAVIEPAKITVISDCAGMYGVYYAQQNGYVYFSAYSQMIADLCGFKEDPYITRMKKSKTFHLYGRYLPGDLTPQIEIKRVLPNTSVTYNGVFQIERFYPRSMYSEYSESEYSVRVKEIAGILHNTMLLILEKWANPEISLTGGVDSQTILAATGSENIKFKYYSYVSIPREETDALAAKKICEALGLQHRIIYVEDCRGSDEFEEVDKLVEKHYAYLGKGNSNDVSKRIVLNEKLNCQLEVKSWVSEVVRASRYKMYGKKTMPKTMTPRMLTTMYKIFLLNRRDAVETDRHFKDYIEHTQLGKKIKEYNYPWSEFFVWEIVFGGWGNMVLTGEHKLSNDITIPHNNRALLDMMLRIPLEKRRTDQLNRDIIKFLNPQLAELNIHVVNGNETKLRAFFEKCYFNVHSHIPY